MARRRKGSKKLRAVVLGAGKMGRALAFDLRRSGFDVVLVDARGGRGVEKADVRGFDLRGFDVAISAVPYAFNVELTRRAIAAGTPFVDLGGNTAVVRRQMKMRARVPVLPDAGLQPGLGAVLAGEAVRRLGGRADEIRVRVGGLPQRPRGRFRYQVVFAEEGLINEYVSRATVRRGGKVRSVAPLSGVETYGALEAFNTGGSASTLPATLRVRDLDVKTIRYAGHAALVRRAGVKTLLRESARSGPDWVVMTVWGRRGRRTVGWSLIDRARGRWSAMMRCTAFPASIVAQMAARGRLRAGALLQERDIPAAEMIRELRRRGVALTQLRGDDAAFLRKVAKRSAYNNRARRAYHP